MTHERKIRIQAAIILTLFLGALATFLYLVVFKAATGPRPELNTAIAQAAETPPCGGLRPVRSDRYFSGNPDVMLRAFVLSGCDSEFVELLDCENGAWDMMRQSDVYHGDVREDSWGLCQINRRWHAETVDDPRFFSDLDWQIGQCLELYRAGEKFSCRGRILYRLSYVEK